MSDVSFLIIGVSALMAFMVSFFLGKVLIPKLQKLKFGQTIRDIGPSWHKKKQGVPTMGGMIFIIAIVVVFAAAALVCRLFFPELMFSVENAAGMNVGVTNLVTTKLFYGVAMAVCCGVLGFVDDYIKVVKKRNLGLTSKQKLLGQLIIGFIYGLALYLNGGSVIEIPFLGIVDMKLFFIPFCMFVVIAMMNAVNLADGIDGLCTTVTFFVSLFFVITAGVAKMFGQSLLAAILGGALIGFLFWNLNPAKVFMGDTGSLFLGGVVTALAFGINKPFVLLLVGIIYIIEVLSVIIQVLYFKATKGKRLFKMSPIHHHFEMVGWKENKIVVIFSLITIVFSVLAYFLFF